MKFHLEIPSFGNKNLNLQGIGTPGKVWKMLKAVLEKVPKEKLAVHFHNTYGQALANILASLEVNFEFLTFRWELML
jgi:pyruvate/oxaloacetate carboxyltransferase